MPMIDIYREKTIYVSRKAWETLDAECEPKAKETFIKQPMVQEDVQRGLTMQKSMVQGETRKEQTKRKPICP